MRLDRIGAHQPPAGGGKDKREQGAAREEPACLYGNWEHSRTLAAQPMAAIDVDQWGPAPGGYFSSDEA
jgi:hypothetical protein